MNFVSLAEADVPPDEVEKAQKLLSRTSHVVVLGGARIPRMEDRG